VTATTDSAGTLSFAHIGDLHITDARQQNFRDFLSILAQIETEAAQQLDFAVLPGDSADNGRPEQYALIATALRMMTMPVQAIPGDHDMEQGGLENFYAGLRVPKLPTHLRLKGHRCLFLDFCGAGEGGPDFRLGEDQLRWLGEQLVETDRANETALLFMHSYPADLRLDGETPADHRLARGSSQRVDREFEVRARVFGHVPIARAECRIEGCDWMPMTRIGTGPDWRATIRSSPDARFDVTVRVLAVNGRPAAHSIRPAGRGFALPKREATGSDAASIGAWPENGISGAQLGPNRNGRKW
jgi:Icc-related predicted phosphoesterase